MKQNSSTFKELEVYLLSRKGKVIALLVLLSTFLAYIPDLQNGFVNWDDNRYVYDNSHIQKLNADFFRWCLTAIVASNWHPLTLLSLALDYSGWGLNPAGFHLTNNLIHDCNTLLVFILSVRLITCRDQEQETHTNRAYTAGMVTALLFGLHPLHVESVVWISERKDVLCAFFYLLSLLTYLRFASTGGQEDKRSYYTALLMFFLSLLSKPMAVSLPFVLLVFDFYPLGRFGPDNRMKRLQKMLLEKWPFFLLSLIASGGAFLAQQAGGGLKSPEDFPFPARCLTAVHAYLFYLYKMIVPIHLVPIYPLPDNTVPLSLENSLSLVLFVFGVILAIRSYRRGRLFFSVWVFYIVTLLPVIGIVQIGKQAAADRYAYLPSLAPFLMAGLGFAVLKEKVHGVRRQTVLICLSILLCSIFVYRTERQIAFWHDSASLWSHEIEIYPTGSALAYNNLATAYKERGRIDLAIDGFDKAIEIEPDRFDAVYNRGLAYHDLGKYEAALNDYDRAIEINASFAPAHYNKGVLLGLLGRHRDAADSFRAAIVGDPYNRNAYYGLSFALTMLGKKSEAVYYQEKARDGKAACDGEC